MKIPTFISATLAMATWACASESFGGIGISFAQYAGNMQVVDIFPGTPAAQSNLQAGDIITAVNGSPVKGKGVSAVAGMLRGNRGEAVTVQFVHEGSTLSTTLYRKSITVKDIENSEIDRWFNNQQAYSKSDVEAFASANEGSLKLAAVTHNGAAIRQGEQVPANNLNGVFVESYTEPHQALANNTNHSPKHPLNSRGHRANGQSVGKIAR